MLNGEGEMTVPAPVPVGSAGRSRALVLSLAVLFLSLVLLVIGFVMFRAGGSERADAREERNQAERALESQRSHTEEAETDRDATIAAAETFLDLLQTALAGSRELEQMNGEELALDRQIRDAGIAGNIDEYNRLVDAVNALLDQEIAQIDALDAQMAQLEEAYFAIQD